MGGHAGGGCGEVAVTVGQEVKFLPLGALSTSLTCFQQGADLPL